MALAVVTGAAGSLGRAIARRLAGDGHRLLLVDVADGVRAVAEEMRRDSHAAESCIADLGVPEGSAAVSAAVGQADAELSVLVNNAGVNRDARAGKMTEREFRMVVRIDLIGPARLSLALRDQMADGGSIINNSSRAALGNFGQANYVAAKSGLIGLTRALAVQWAPGVRVNAVAPGLIDTPMTSGMPEEVLAKLVARVPAQRMGTADEVAEAVAFLASPASSYVTGQYVPICGGRSVA
jgi:3-oxoacyl-[acyl-carrier protein] reductase